jgi:hypothetical protein
MRFYIRLRQHRGYKSINKFPEGALIFSEKLSDSDKGVHAILRI